VTFTARAVIYDETWNNTVNFHVAEWLRSNELEIIEL
jgi:hypothetical protein